MNQTYVLLLDSSYFPLHMIDWKKALTLFFTGRAEVVEHHLDATVRSTHDVYKLPKVMRLFTKIGDFNRVKFSRQNVIVRDNYTCQYCSKKFLASDLTMDHVYPKSKGGPTSWENIVACCKKCNCVKADYLPKEIKMFPLKKPLQPRWVDLFLKKLNQKNRSHWKSWFYK